MEEFLKKIGIKDEGHKSDDGCLVVDIKDEDTFFKYESLLDNSSLVDLDEDSSNVTYESITKQYESEKFLITLIGDDSDTYKITVKNL